MKPIGLTLLVVALAMVVAISGSLTAAPQMTIPESVFNFGYVPQHSKISHIFWLHSSGDDSLKILKVVPG